VPPALFPKGAGFSFSYPNYNPNPHPCQQQIFTVAGSQVLFPIFPSKTISRVLFLQSSILAARRRYSSCGATETERATLYVSSLASNGVCMCPRGFPLGGRLLPHLSTLTQRQPQSRQAVYFCCTFLRVAPSRRYLPSCPVMPGLSSPELSSAIACFTQVCHPVPMCQARDGVW